MSDRTNTIVIAAGIVAASLATAATATPLSLTKAFANVTIRIADNEFEPGSAARGYCKAKGFATAAGYQFGFYQSFPRSRPDGRAFYPSITCLRGLS